MRDFRQVLALLGIAVSVLTAVPAMAQSADDSPGQEAPPPADEAGSAQELAKKLSNPVASLISVPFQENLDFGGGPDGDGVKSTLNIQPVVPIALSKDWNLIVRTIVPVVFQDDITGPLGGQSGLGDITQSFFFSPRETGPGGIVWGVGPVVVYPSATDDLLGNKKWDAGVTGLVLKQAGKSTFGVLANQVWSVAGSDSRQDVSAMFLQPFYSYTTRTATTFGLNAEASYDWKGDQWVVPVNLTVSQLTKIGKQPVSIGGGFRYYAEKPAGGPDWGARLILTFLFPKK
jgi:hypothetical protein